MHTSWFDKPGVTGSDDRVQILAYRARGSRESRSASPNEATTTTIRGRKIPGIVEIHRTLSKELRP